MEVVKAAAAAAAAAAGAVGVWDAGCPTDDDDDDDDVIACNLTQSVRQSIYIHARLDEHCQDTVLL